MSSSSLMYWRAHVEVCQVGLREVLKQVAAKTIYKGAFQSLRLPGVLEHTSITDPWYVGEKVGNQKYGSGTFGLQLSRADFKLQHFAR